LNYFKQNWLKLYFVSALLIVAFVYGVFVAEDKVFPYQTLSDGRAAARDWWKNWRDYTTVPQQKFLKKSVHSGKGVITNIPDKTWEGVTFFTGLVEKSVGMRLINMKGESLHSWKVSFNEIWPKADFLDSQPGDFHQSVNGAKLYANGDIIFNFGRKSIVKIDKCSNVIWKLPFLAHHSVDEDNEGNIWFPSIKKLKTPHRVYREVLIEKPEFIFKITPEGKLLKEINVLESIKKSDLTALLTASGSRRLLKTTIGDYYTHLNSVKILKNSIADAFPQFNAGDLLVSIRNFNMILVIDPNTELVKWHMSGPFIRQHDPDFLENGHISVFDNRGGRDQDGSFGKSRILEIDPVSKKYTVRYEGDEANPFSSEIMGHQQMLPNQNILITESNKGRIFEVDSKGEIVWSYINRWDEKQSITIYQAERYSKNYSAFISDPC
jgi:hypothetical protein